MSDRRRGFHLFGRISPLAASYLCVFLYSAGEAALHVLVPPYLADGRGYGPGLIGVLLAVFALSSLVMRLPVGASYSTRRVRPLLLAGGLLSAGAFALVPLTQGAVTFGVLMGMDGVGWAIATTTQLTIMVASRPARLSVASVMGWYSGFTGLGHAVGGVMAGVVADNLGYTAGFYLLAAFPALATVVMLKALPGQLAAAARARGPVVPPYDAEAVDRAAADPETVDTETVDSEAVDTAAVDAAAGGSPDDRRRPGPAATLRAARSLPAVVYAGALIMFFINVQSALFSSFQPVLALAAGLTLTQIGLLAGIRSLASSITRMASGPLFSRISGRSLTTPMFILGAASLFLLPVVRDSFWLQAVVFAAAGLSRGLLRVTGAAAAFEDAENTDDAADGQAGQDREPAHGLVSAFLHMGLDLGKVVGPPLGGVLAEVVGVAAMFQVCAVGLLVVYGGFKIAATSSRARR